MVAAIGTASSTATNPPASPAIHAPRSAPIKTAAKTSSGLIFTVRLMTIGFNT
jgi:hypothetical protein